MQKQTKKKNKEKEERQYQMALHSLPNIISSPEIQNGFEKILLTLFHKPKSSLYLLS